MIKLYLNYPRTFLVYLLVLNSDQSDLIKKDIARWSTEKRKNFKSLFAALNYFLTMNKEFRNLLLHRLWNPTRDMKAKIHVSLARCLWRPMETLYLCTREIGGGLYIQHGFATHVSAQRIGENCWINQQVTIGYKGEHCPVIMDNVKIHCGAKVLGELTMHNNSVAGANAVVVKSVPENAVVGGVPAKIIRYQD